VKCRQKEGSESDIKLAARWDYKTQLVASKRKVVKMTIRMR